MDANEPGHTHNIDENSKSPCQATLKQTSTEGCDDRNGSGTLDIVPPVLHNIETFITSRHATLWDRSFPERATQDTPARTTLTPEICNDHRVCQVT